MNTISLCMIVKNEETTLSRILSIVKNICEEIIIVDTGSTDRTKSIAARFTDKIYDFAFNNDFSAARNFSFDKATMDYILWLDADDYIDDENILKIQKLKKTDLYADIYMFYYKNYNTDTKKYDLIFYRERLLKRDKNFRFCGFVHEAINLSGNIEYVDITIEHRKIRQNPKMRNLNIYLTAKKEKRQFTPRDTYYFARELYYNGYYKKAAAQFKKFIKTGGYKPDIEESYILLCGCYLRFKDIKKAEDYIFTALKNFQPYPELLCKAGEIYFNLNNLEKAAFFYTSALYAKQKNHGFIRQDYQDLIPYLMLTVIYYRLKDFDMAKKCHQMCKLIAPDNKAVQDNDKIDLLK